MMDGGWITSPSARRVQQHATDPRPAWLWSADGQTLLWQNAAADLFLARIKKHGLKHAAPAVPIKGQVARNIRLGTLGRTSLARIQFIAGDKPVSSTCATTPLPWENDQPALLIVGVDPIADDILASALNSSAKAWEQDDAVAGDLSSDAAPAQHGEPENEAPEEQEPQPASPESSLNVPPVATITDMPDVESTPLEATPDELVQERELENWREAEAADQANDDPTDKSDLEPVATEVDIASGEASGSRLSRLMDQLASDEALFTPLTAADDNFRGADSPAELSPPNDEEIVQERVIEPEQADAERDLDALSQLDNPNDGGEDGDSVDPIVEPEAVETIIEPAVPSDSAAEPADPEAVERVSRYNFDELSRILNDRVGEAATPSALTSEPSRGGALINLGGETLVLNRLPLGILVFRDQQVLFANRAITEMVGYQSVEALRAAGLAAVFPAAGPEGQEAGPVNHLVQRNGTLVPVTARLQSISWQGRPALMLSASTTEVRTGHEAAVRAFAQTAADLRGDGFFEATRTGVLSAVTPRAALLLGADGPLEGKPLSALVAPREVSGLQDFLERPARFAESERPYLNVRSTSGKAEIVLFAQGQAGVVTNYFGFVRGHELTPLRIAAPAEVDSALLGRISRGVRRPLNTILGFADLLRSQAFGTQQDKTGESYAQDILTAGQEIAALVDELENFARLRDGRYLPQRSSIDLTAVLESCVLRIRQQASGARVIVRNAISETLPRVTADRASLEQAVLNLLASAIDQSPTGGAVVISAKLEDDGAISVHVRDSSNNAVDMAERFVVFRDGVGRDGQSLAPVRSSVGLALTRSLLAVNSFLLSVDPAGERGLLFTLLIPVDLVQTDATSGVAE